MLCFITTTHYNNIKVTSSDMKEGRIELALQVYQQGYFSTSTVTTGV
jgi:hypothetical protein